MKKGTFNAHARAGGEYDITFAPYVDDAPGVPTGGSIGRHPGLSLARVEHFMRTTLQLEMTPEQLTSFVSGTGHKGEISVQNYKDYFQG